MKVRLTDVINPVKWVSFLIGTIKGKALKVHIIEQYMWRFLNCPQCIEQGVCRDCGCTMPDKALVHHETCSEGEWGPILSEKEWKEYKKEYDIQFILKSKFH